MTHADPASTPSHQPSAVNVFLSYAHEDEEIVGQIAHKLAHIGLYPFMAVYHIRAAKEWLPRIESELRRSHALVAFLSPAFRGSAWTNQEVGYALALGKKILPAQIAPQSPPEGFLQRYQALALHNLGVDDMATLILDWLITEADATDPLANLVASRLRNERSEPALRFWAERLQKLDNLPATTLAAVESAVAANAAIQTNQALAAHIMKIIDSHRQDESRP